MVGINVNGWETTDLDLPGMLTLSTLHTSELVLKMFSGAGDIAQWGSACLACKRL